MSKFALLDLPVIRFFGAAAALAASASVACAASGPSTGSDFVEARLISAIDGVGQLDAVPLGVELRVRQQRSIPKPNVTSARPHQSKRQPKENSVDVVST